MMSSTDCITSGQAAPIPNFLGMRSRSPAADFTPPRRGAGRRASRLGFSLIELLTVVAMIGLLSALIAPAVSSIGKATSLVTAGNNLVGLVDQARQNSMAKNVMTALIAIKGSSSNAVGFGLFEYVPEATGWKQISKWETLKDGIVAYYNNPDYPFTDGTIPPPIANFSGIKYRGATTNAFQYLIFLPSRGLLQNTSAQLQLAEGFATTAGAITFTRPSSGGGKPANFYTVSVLAMSGRPKIDRP